MVSEDLTRNPGLGGPDSRPPSKPVATSPVSAVAGAAGRLRASLAGAARAAVRLLIPARLRRIYVPSAWSAIDRITVIAFGFVCGIFQATGRFPNPQDARDYWTTHLTSLYPTNWGPGGTYIYPPPLAQLIALLQPIGWPAFIVIWTTLLWAALAYILGRWTWAFVALGIVALVFRLPYAFGDVLGHALNGNVQLFIAAGIVFAMRADGRNNALGWLPGLLTKVVSGLGMGWYVFRLEWRPVAIALAAAAAVSAVSFAFGPNLWFQWIDWTVKNAGTAPPVQVEPIPFLIRLAMSLALLFWGARTNRTWVVPIAVGWGTPALYLGTYVSIWIGAIPLYWWARQKQSATAAQKVAPAADSGR